MLSPDKLRIYRSHGEHYQALQQELAKAKAHIMESEIEAGLQVVTQTARGYLKRTTIALIGRMAIRDYSR